jgi:hypothetical protein
LSRRLIASRFWRFGQFRFAAELDAARLGAFAAFTGAGADQLAPVLGHSAFAVGTALF